MIFVSESIRKEELILVAGKFALSLMSSVISCECVDDDDDNDDDEREIMFALTFGETENEKYASIEGKNIAERIDEADNASIELLSSSQDNRNDNISSSSRPSPQSSSF